MLSCDNDLVMHSKKMVQVSNYSSESVYVNEEFGAVELSSSIWDGCLFWAALESDYSVNKGNHT